MGQNIDEKQGEGTSYISGNCVKDRNGIGNTDSEMEMVVRVLWAGCKLQLAILVSPDKKSHA